MTAAHAITTAPSDTAPVSVDELVRTHLPLVGHAVRELITRLPSHVNRDDLVSAGMLALVLTARNFDPSRGVPFGRFASIRIKGALTDELRTMDWASRAVRGKAREMDAVRTELTTALRRTPSRPEVASAMGVKVSDLDSVDADVQRASVLSLHALTPDAGAELVPSRTDGPEALLLHREQIGYLRDAIEELPARLHTVVRQYFFEQRKMADIAADLGVTESRISQLRAEALGMLRDGLRATDSEHVKTPAATPRRRAAAAREAYAVAVTTRSTLSQRLQATSVLGEPLRAAV
ncbi:MAG: sigma-70 family RNA polymerase sigma factor [Actinomycetota bacterium]|nr:sigma-70 family RNA polymerase sigma factor [Actinomycetota bacterium]